MIERLVTLLPQPDSPTRPMISPRSTWKSMPSTARTTPSRVWNDVRRPVDLEQRPLAALVARSALADGGTSSSMTSLRRRSRTVGRASGAPWSRPPSVIG